MQFDTKVLYHHKKIVVESILDGFKKLGGVNTESFMWEFPTFITPQVIQEIIHNTCFVCGGLMQNAILLENGKHCISEEKANTSNNSKAIRKCSSCGHSHT